MNLVIWKVNSLHKCKHIRQHILNSVCVFLLSLQTKCKVLNYSFIFCFFHYFQISDIFKTINYIKLYSINTIFWQNFSDFVLHFCAFIISATWKNLYSVLRYCFKNRFSAFFYYTIVILYQYIKKSERDRRLYVNCLPIYGSWKYSLLHIYD